MSFHVFIPSKGRPSCRTAQLLEGSAVSFTIIVEPQDWPTYEPRWGASQLHQLPQDDQGIAYARQQIMNLAKSSGHDWCWMLDDDITALSRFDSVTGKYVKAPAWAVLQEASAWLDGHPRVALAGLAFRQFGWAAKGAPTWGNCPLCAVAVSKQAAGLLRYPIGYLMEDKHVALQALTMGLQTVTMNAWGLTTNTMGSLEGGCQMMTDRAAAGERSARWLREQWPGLVKLVRKPNGWVDTRINWRAARGG